MFCINALSMIVTYWILHVKICITCCINPRTLYHPSDIGRGLIRQVIQILTCNVHYIIYFNHAFDNTCIFWKFSKLKNNNSKFKNISKLKKKNQKFSKKFKIFKKYMYYQRHGWNIWYNEHYMSKSVSLAVSTLDLYPRGDIGF